MLPEKHGQIEQRAYALWQAEGQPHGKHEEHWHRAAREIEAEERGSHLAKPLSRRSSGKGRMNSRSPVAQARKKSKDDRVVTT